MNVSLLIIFPLLESSNPFSTIRSKASKVDWFVKATLNALLYADYCNL